MENIELKKIENDERQLNIMRESLDSFENNWIDLNSLIDILVFTCGDLKCSKMQWMEKFSKEVTVLKNNKSSEIYNEYQERLIKNTVLNLKVLIRKELNKLFFDKCDAS